MTEQSPAEIDEEAKFYGDDDSPLTVFSLSSYEHLVVGTGPWAALALHRQEHDVRVRLERDGSKLVITGVAVLSTGRESPEPVTVTDLREVPLMRVQALLDHPTWSSAVAWAMSCAGEFGRDLSPGSGVSAHDVDWGERQVPPPPTDFKIRGADATPRSETFYLDVAGAWSSALASGHKNPAQVLADANGVATSAVHRWVRVARQLGYLAPSSRSAARGRPQPATP